MIGYDARAHPPSGGSSERFASLAAAVFISRGVPVHLFSDITPTPFVVTTSIPSLGLGSRCLVVWLLGQIPVEGPTGICPAGCARLKGLTNPTCCLGNTSIDVVIDYGGVDLGGADLSQWELLLVNSCVCVC